MIRLAYKLLETEEVLKGSNLKGLIYSSILTKSSAFHYCAEQDTEIVELFLLFYHSLSEQRCMRYAESQKIQGLFEMPVTNVVKRDT